MTGPRDWDKEMAEIDKLMGSERPALPAGAAPVARRESAAPVARDAAPAPMTRRRDTAGVWFRAVLGAAGAAALPFWPYAKSCGLPLYLYLIGTAGVIAAGIWTMRGAWTHRRGIAHSAGLLVLVAGLTLAALEIAQRTGFAAVRLTWTCP